MMALSEQHFDVEDRTKSIHFEDLRYFKYALAQDADQGRMVIKLCRLLNKLVPIFLSRPFHTMSCLEMYRNYPNGKYWSKASLFVVGNAQIGQFVRDKLQKEELQPECVQQVTHPFLSKELCEKFKDNFLVSNDDREYTAFGLNSWVLQQIPIYPTMMFQWWLSSSYYLLKLETLVADFYYLKFPLYLQKTVEAVVDVIKRARFYLNIGLQCLISIVKDEEKFKSKHYEDVISEVSIVLQSYCRTGDTRAIDAIKCLKRMCWSESSEREVNISPKDWSIYGAYTKKAPCEHELTLLLWDYLPSSLFMRTQLVANTGCTSCKEIIGPQKLRDFEDAKKMNPDFTPDKVKLLISKVTIKKGRFCADDEEALLRHSNDPETIFLFFMWLRNRGFLLEGNEPLDEADKGPFYDVLVSTAELEQANLEAALAQSLSRSSGIKSKAVDCEGPDMTLEEIEKVLLRDIELEPPWTFASALKESQRQVSLSKDTYEYHEDSTAFFQYQLDSMALRVAEECYDLETAKEFIAVDQHDELRFMQYLLPCFLSSYFDLKEDKRVSLKARNFYLNFIKQLLKLWGAGIYKGGLNVPEKTVCFLKWKFETVCMDLEEYLYNDLEDSISNDLTEQEQPPFITRTMKTNCFDVLTDFLGKTEDLTYFFRWRLHLYVFSNSLQSSLFKLTEKPPGFSGKWGAELRAMSVLSRILAARVFKKYAFKDKIEYDQTNLLFGAVFKSYAKSEKLMKIGKMPGATRTDTWSDFQAKVETESDKLSEQQKLALVLYMCLSSTSVKNMKDNATNYDTFITLCVDAVERAYYQIKSGQHLKVKQTLSAWQRDDEGVNQAQVGYKYAMEVAPLCYSVVTCRLTKDMKIQMKEPGEITFCPVRHCRWCGQVETEEKELFVCQFCKDIPEYPDVNLFCSLDCEEKTLDKKHRQEHTEVVEMQLGLRDVEHFMENLSVTPDCLDQLEPDLVGTDEDVQELEELEPNMVADSTDATIKDLPKLETDVGMEGEVDARSFCGKCLNKEPKGEVYLVCKGGCDRKFHLECIEGALDSEGILQNDFLALSLSTWSCETCPSLSCGDVDKRISELSMKFQEVSRQMELISEQVISHKANCRWEPNLVDLKKKDEVLTGEEVKNVILEGAVGS